MSAYRDSLTPKQRKSLDDLTDLRASGYTGPINQDGLPVVRENTDHRLWNPIQGGQQQRKAN